MTTNRSASWASIGRRARAFRIAHTAWAVVAVGALGYIWASAAVRRRDRALYASVAFLSVQGVGLIIGRGNCPMGPFQRSLGDPVPLFELILPPRAAKAAIPTLLVITLAGMMAVVVRQPEARHLPALIRRGTRRQSRAGPLAGR